MAVTQNYCNDSNFETVCAEMNFDDEDFYEGKLCCGVKY